MPGTLARATESFVVDTYGVSAWRDVVRAARVDVTGFELMLSYAPEVTEPVFEAAATRLGRTRAELMEDVGTYLVSHPNMAGLRRLLRYGGENFEAFLFSLRSLPGRARLVLPELTLPNLRLTDRGGGCYWLDCTPALPDVSAVILGAIRAMADDYGALAMTQLLTEAASDGDAPTCRIEIILLDARFAAGRAFELGQTGS